MTGKKIKRNYLLLVVIFSLSLTFQLLALDDSEINDIQNFTKTIYVYETAFFQTGQIDSSDFAKCSQTYAQLIELYISLGEKYSEEQFSQLAFAYLEKFKNLKMLKLFIQAVTPDSEATKLKKNLNQNFKFSSDYFKLQNELLFNQTNSDLIIKQINESKKSMTSLLDSVLTNGPVLSFFLLMQKPADIFYLQTECLSTNEAIVDYWIQKEKMIVFTVTSDTFIISQMQLPAERTKQQVLELTSPLYLNQDLLNLKFDYKLSYQLYQKLFQPIEKHLERVKIVIIIPDNFLTSFPFELLVTDTTKINNSKNNILYHDSKEVDYLIGKYAFCYNYSIAALDADVSKIRSREKLGRKLLTMSEPIIKNKDQFFYSKTGIASDLPLVNSDYSADEIKRVSRLLWRNHNLKGLEVTKEYFFEKGKNYRWIYLAQPGILNNMRPSLSGLVFSKKTESDDFSSSWFSCKDAMQSFLRADMLTLSSCKLNPAFSKENEGVFAFPQSFLFSGVRSVVHNQWGINSISSSQFMSKFYWELKYKRQTNVKALQEAKLASMKDTFKFSNKEISRAHPFFWAGFRLIGSPKVTSPSNAPIPPWGIVIIVYLILIAGALIITKKTITNKE